MLACGWKRIFQPQTHGQQRIVLIISVHFTFLGVSADYWKKKNWTLHRNRPVVQLFIFLLTPTPTYKLRWRHQERYIENTLRNQIAHSNRFRKPALAAFAAIKLQLWM